MSERAAVIIERANVSCWQEWLVTWPSVVSADLTALFAAVMNSFFSAAPLGKVALIWSLYHSLRTWSETRCTYEQLKLVPGRVQTKVWSETKVEEFCNACTHASVCLCLVMGLSLTFPCSDTSMSCHGTLMYPSNFSMLWHDILQIFGRDGRRQCC